MQSIRHRGLSPGWYPSSTRAIERQCATWRASAPGTPELCAAVVPHAGWEFSGQLAFRGVGAISAQVDTIVVIGGHLGSDSPVLVAREDRFRAPHGDLLFDLELTELLATRFSAVADNDRENSVEIHLPMIKFLYPQARVVWVRAPASEVSVELGTVLGRWAADHTIAVLGSTDLTHYGPRFGFVRPGPPEESRRWVSQVNDRGFIDCVRSGDTLALLEHARRNRSACSPGAAAAVVSFAHTVGSTGSTELGYATSCDLASDENLVGYAAIGWAKRRLPGRQNAIE